MTDAEKVAAFDLLAVALTNRWDGTDGRWTWWCPSPAGGEAKFDTRDGAVADLVSWAGRAAAANRKRLGV